MDNDLVDRKTNSYLKLPYKILNRLWDRIKTKPVIEYHLESNKSLDEVLNIFVRINNGGKPVELSELLISLVTAQLKDFDVENELIKIVNEVNNIGGEKSFNVSNDFVLKAFLVLCGDNSNDKNSIKFKIENFKPQRIQKIREEWQSMTQALKLAVTLLNEFGFNQNHFASNNALIPLAQYIYLKGNNPAAYAADKGKMIHWFISATLNGIFGARTDATLIKFRKCLNANHKNFPILEMLDAKDKSSDEIADELINALMNTTYKYMKNVLMALTILYDGKINLATVDVDHMFPKVTVKNIGEMVRQGIADEEKFQADFKKFCNALPNLQLLDSAENKKKSSTYFNYWIAAKPAAEREKYMAENFVPDVDFRLVNFKNFIDARAKLIREKITENLKAHGVIYFDINAESATDNLPDDSTVKLSAVDDKESARELEKILDMATHIEKQFANAYVTANGKFMFYSNYDYVSLEPDAKKYNPEFFVISTELSKDKKLLTPRVSRDIMRQEVIPQNVFVEITKEDLAKANQIAKKNGAEAALKYLESTAENNS